MNIVIQNYINASVSSAAQLEAKIEGVILDHQFAMFCYDLEDLIRNALGIQKGINRDVERIQDKQLLVTANPGDKESFEMGWHDLYIKLENLCGKIDSLIRKMSELGYGNLEGTDEFRIMWREVRGIASVDPKKLDKAKDQIASGRFKSARDLLIELSGNPV